jgi:hypothetical protein
MLPRSHRTCGAGTKMIQLRITKSAQSAKITADSDAGSNCRNSCTGVVLTMIK